MKHMAMLSLLFMLSACSCEGAMSHYSSGGFFGHGLSYPGYSNSLSLIPVVVGNNTSAISPVFLSDAVFLPEFRFMNQNSSGYYHPILPLWDQFTFYLPFSSVKDFLRADWKPATTDYVTSAVRQVMQEDVYREGVEPHNDPGRTGRNHFLDDDEPPERPLL